MDIPIMQMRRVAVALTSLKALGCQRPSFTYQSGADVVTVSEDGFGQIRICDGHSFVRFSSVEALVRTVESVGVL